MQRHIDYITPGIKLLEVEDVKRSQSINKRTFGGIGNGESDPLPPILKPLLLPLSELLGATLALCDVAVTPACISGMSTATVHDVRYLTHGSHVQHYQRHKGHQGQ